MAPLETTVLVYGESGTGKEFIVRMIHDQSRRAAGPFVSVNCAALTETLLESELFGHVRGAFTGAVRDKPGCSRWPTDGTLFLDEIGEVAPAVQAKLLRALQEREIRRVGGERTIKVQRAGGRGDQPGSARPPWRPGLSRGSLLPPRRVRHHGAAAARPPGRHSGARPRIRRARGRPPRQGRQNVSAEAMTRWCGYGWPGNVRELENAIERAVILARGTSVTLRELPPEI